MKLFRFRGPRLGTKLMLLGVALLSVPWFSYRQLVEMERLLIQGQKHAQLLTAEGISTLFNGRNDLFNDLPIALDDYEALFAHPLQSPVRLDGDLADWGDALVDKQLSFGSPESSTSGGDRDANFRLLLGERGGSLYVYLDVVDNSLIYRNPQSLRLDNADHVRLSFIQTNGEDGRITLVLPGEGPLTAFAMGPEWRFAATGTPENRIQGFLRPTETGFRVEFRLPLDMLGSRRHFGVAFVDVDNAESREVTHISQTLPTAGKQSFNLVVLRSPEVLNIIQGLGYSGARILVIDPQRRVRAETGTVQSERIITPVVEETAKEPESLTDRFRRWFSAFRPMLHRVVMGESQNLPVDPAEAEAAADEAIGASLRGEPIALRRRLGGDREIIMAAHPIISKDTILGTVVVEQNLDDILRFQSSALEQVILLSVVSLLVVFLALLAFAGRLAWRIRNLRREASAAIDQYGRLRTSSLRSEMHAGDEIGDLARSVSNMLSKLHQHNTFLESMPRTLRHEINNPLNTLSTSLQNLAEEHAEVRDSKYLESAKRGVLRIGVIVQNLADAANLEDSLESEEFEIVDLNELLASYVANCHITHPQCQFAYRGPDEPVLAEVSDFRIEQLLDKIIDNAIDFHRRDTAVKVQLDTYRDTLQITVANRGPTLPDNAERSLFDSMVSHRGPQNRLHFGLGLYVVRVIAEYHGGFVRAMNLADGSGVAIVVQLPRLPTDASLRPATETIEVEAEETPRLVALR